VLKEIKALATHKKKIKKDASCLFETFPRVLDELLGLRLGRPYKEGFVEVAVVFAVVDGHVDVDDVAVLLRAKLVTVRGRFLKGRYLISLGQFLKRAFVPM
jgi:hypothetical protein